MLLVKSELRVKTNIAVCKMLKKKRDWSSREHAMRMLGHVSSPFPDRSQYQVDNEKDLAKTCCLLQSETHPPQHACTHPAKTFAQSQGSYV